MRSFRTKTMRRCRPRHGQIAVEHLENLEPEERNRVYKMLDLKVLAHEDANLEVKSVENAGGLGRHLVQRLAAAGESVVDVPCSPVRAAKK